MSWITTDNMKPEDFIHADDEANAKLKLEEVSELEDNPTLQSDLDFDSEWDKF